MFIHSVARTRRFLTLRFLSTKHRRPFFQSVLSQAGFVTILLLGTMAVPNAQALQPGEFIGWGPDSFGETQPPRLVPPITDISALSSSSGNTIALRSNGTVIVWGDPTGPVSPPPGLKNVTAVSAANAYMMALQRNGNVVIWGNFPNAGVFVDGSLTNIAAIAASDRFPMVLKRDGTVVQWSAVDGNPVQIPSGLEGIKAISTYFNRGMALKSDGTVISWLLDTAGINPQPDGLTDVVAIAANRVASYALKADGTIVAWGQELEGTVVGVNGLTNIKAIATGRFHGVALTAAGEVKAWGVAREGATAVPLGITNGGAIAAGATTGFALNPVPLLTPYTFSGFQRPVDGAPVINIGLAGRTYPVKWQLKDGAGGFVSRLSAFKSLTSSRAKCGAFLAQPLDLLETRASGPAGLTYDSVSNQYVFNWKAPSIGCYTMSLTLDNDQVYTANFVIL